MNRLSAATLTCVLAFLLSSCATTTRRDKRIANHPEWYEALSAEDKLLVSQGRIREGMEKNAVFLAWGPADGVTSGTDHGKPTETWYYTTYQPQYLTGFSFGYGGYYGRGYPDPGIGYGFGWPGPYPYTDVVYLERPAALVRFEKDRVVAWQVRR